MMRPGETGKEHSISESREGHPTVVERLPWIYKCTSGKKFMEAEPLAKSLGRVNFPPISTILLG